jgi:hypothetical protein
VADLGRTSVLDIKIRLSLRSFCQAAKSRRHRKICEFYGFLFSLPFLVISFRPLTHDCVPIVPPFQKS